MNTRSSNPSGSAKKMDQWQARQVVSALHDLSVQSGFQRIRRWCMIQRKGGASPAR
jgi:hypothetical protein